MDNDTISRQAAIDFIDAGRLVNPNEPRWSDNEVVAFLKSRPSAERRGRWIEEYSANHFQAKCSACGESTLYGITYDLEGNAYYMNYCPNCGATMEADE